MAQKTQAQANLEAITGGAGRYFGEPVGLPEHQGTIGVPSGPGQPELTLEDAIREDEWRRQVEAQRWQQLNPQEQIMEYAGLAADIADLPIGAGKAMITGSPQVAAKLTEAVKRLGAAAPESYLGKWAKRVLDPQNLDEVIEGMRGKAPQIRKAEIAHELRSGQPTEILGATSGKDPGLKQVYLDLEREAGDIFGTAVHETGGHAFSAQGLPPAQRKWWAKQVEKHGRHPSVGKGYAPESVAEESLAQTMSELATGAEPKNRGLFDALLQALGID
jgi:hypothetical protein